VQYAEARAGVSPPAPAAAPAPGPLPIAPGSAGNSSTMPKSGTMLHTLVNSSPNAAESYANLARGGMDARTIEYMLASMHAASS